jgi:polyadenylate-binding protein
MTSLPSASLYVGDLSPEVTEGLLFDIFKRVGTVTSIRVCRDSLNNSSLGYAYVNFNNPNDADRALATLNNTVIKGKPCRIMWSQRDPSIRKSGVGNIFIKNLHPSIGHKELHDTFSQFGNILSCKVALDKSGVSKGFGFVHFEKPESAQRAIELVNGKVLVEKEVYVNKFIPRKEWLAMKASTWTNVYVKDFGKDITDKQLEDLFAAYGEITSAIIMRTDDGTSKGFGFVNFAEHEAAVKAVDELHLKQSFGDSELPLYCARFQRKAERQAELKKRWEILRRERLNKYAGVNLYIKNIEDHIDEERIRNEFEQFGEIESVKIMKNERNQSRGFGFVCFKTPEAASAAFQQMSATNRILPGCSKPLYVNYHEPKEIRSQRLQARYATNRNKFGRGAVPQAGYFGGNVPPQNPMYQPYGPNMMPPNRRWGPQSPHKFQQPMPNMMVPGQVAWQQRNPDPNAAAAGRGRGRGMPPGGQPGMRPPMPEEENFTLQQITQFPKERQEVLLGEKLYVKVHEYEPELAKKITGMLLGSGWPISELYGLLHNEEKLKEHIDDAVKLLHKKADEMKATEEGENVPVMDEE